ncbi:MAG: hypothetical protein M3Q58_00115 [Bacteroidota bacterium]|nr:hypothetical protein [Bacteroidota bacterium]
MRLFSIFIILLFVQGIVFSQKHNLKHFSIDEGLPQASVYCVYQDLQGYIWFGTQGGVAKFDGLEFENFTQKDGLAENHITSIFQDSLGDFWFGHRYEGISIMKGSKIISLKGNLPEMTEQVSCFS